MSVYLVNYILFFNTAYDCKQIFKDILFQWIKKKTSKKERKSPFMYLSTNMYFKSKRKLRVVNNYNETEHKYFSIQVDVNLQYFAL